MRSIQNQDQKCDIDSLAAYQLKCAEQREANLKKAFEKTNEFIERDQKTLASLRTEVESGESAFVKSDFAHKNLESSRRSLVTVGHTTFNNAKADRKTYLASAQTNLEKWKKEKQKDIKLGIGDGHIHVHEGDTTQITRALTKASGKRFVVLNMANSTYPGGGFLSGCLAQEEVLFRLSTLSAEITAAITVRQENGPLMYSEAMHQLISGYYDRAFLSPVESCIVRDYKTGFSFLKKDEITPFRELRIAADSLRPRGPVLYLCEDIKSESTTKLINAADNREVRIYLDSKNIAHVYMGNYLCGKAPFTSHSEVLKAARKKIGEVKEVQSFHYDHKEFADVLKTVFPPSGQLPLLPFYEPSMRRVVRAILTTLFEAKEKNVVLGALGCGAFYNPGNEVARIFCEEIQRTDAPWFDFFEEIHFAVYDPSYQPTGNYPIFLQELDNKPHNLSINMNYKKGKDEAKELKSADALVINPTRELAMILNKNCSDSQKKTEILQKLVQIKNYLNSFEILAAIDKYMLNDQYCKLMTTRSALYAMWSKRSQGEEGTTAIQIRRLLEECREKIAEKDQVESKEKSKENITKILNESVSVYAGKAGMVHLVIKDCDLQQSQKNITLLNKYLIDMLRAGIKRQDISGILLLVTRAHPEHQPYYGEAYFLRISSQDYDAILTLFNNLPSQKFPAKPSRPPSKQQGVSSPADNQSKGLNGQSLN